MVHRSLTAPVAAGLALAWMGWAVTGTALAQSTPDAAAPAPAAPAAAAAAPPSVAPVLPKATATAPSSGAPSSLGAAPVSPGLAGAPPPAASTGALIPPPAPPATPVLTGTAPAATSPATPAVKAATTIKRKAGPPPAPRETALSTDPNPSLTPETFFATAKASERYAAIADAGGWPTIEGPVSPGAKGRAVSTLRLRLAIEGDLSPPARNAGPVTADEGSGMFDTRWGPDLSAAVKRFQSRHGLKDTGVVSGATLKALNVSARTRFTELASSAQRLAGRQFAFGDRYVVVNLPSASVEAVENGQVVHRYVAIVGDPEHASPEVDAKAIAVNINPTWTVPTSIIKNEIIPKMQKDPGYLARQHIRILDGAGNEIEPRSINWSTQRATNFILRQDSGKANSLGQIRINMPNKFSVYMHDTPGKRAFGGDDRFLSHGCVRVQGVNDLAAWLLKDSLGAPDGLWSSEAISQKIEEGEHEEIRLARAVPVAWVYMTGWANADGIVNFRDDVYGIDTVGTAAEARVDPAQMPGGQPAR